MPKKVQQKSVKTKPDHRSQWHHFDASGKVVGRLATEIAHLLMGKHEVTFAKHIPASVHIVVTNTDKIVLTGRKEVQKMYRHYTGYPGGLKERSATEQRKRDSRILLAKAVEGMLPKNNLRQVRMKQLHLYPGNDHPHRGQLTA